MVHGIHVPDEEQEQLRSLFRRRHRRAKKLRTIKNHIKSRLLYYGAKLPEQFDNPNWSHEMKTWISNISWKFSCAPATMKSRLKQLDFLWHEELHISNVKELGNTQKGLLSPKKCSWYWWLLPLQAYGLNLVITGDSPVKINLLLLSAFYPAFIKAAIMKFAWVYLKEVTAI